MTINARNGGVTLCQRKPALLMLRQCERRPLKPIQRVACVAAVLPRCGSKLARVCIQVAIRARIVSHLVNGVFAGGFMALIAGHRKVFSREWITRFLVPLQRKQ